MKEDLEMNRAALDAASYEQTWEKADFSIYVTGEDVRTYIPNIPDKYIGQVAIFDGELVLLVTGLGDEDKQTAESLGIKVMDDTDYNYMLELKYLEIAVLNHKDDLAKIGTELSTTSYETIAGINYGLGWYKISTNEELTNLRLTTEQLGYMNVEHRPYIVKYSTGSVQSKPGKLMYEGTDNAIWKYTFNYKGEANGLVVNNLVAAAIRDSNKTSSAWGIFSNYGSNGLQYDTDTNGNECLKLDGNDVANMTINQNVEINKYFTVNITVKGDYSNQILDDVTKSWYWPDDNPKKHGGTILAMSDNEGKYVLWISVINNHLRVLDYHGHYNSGDGAISFGIESYNNEYLNIQIVAERGGKTKIYLNGTFVDEFNSGSEIFSYNNLCLGDLRTGRGLKYQGNIYNFALYGDKLTDEEIAQNWNYVRDELRIDTNGDKIIND